MIKIKKKAFWTLLAIVSVLSLNIFQQIAPTSARSVNEIWGDTEIYQDCMGNSGTHYDTIPSIVVQCDACAKNHAGIGAVAPHGAMWLGTRASNVVDVSAADKKRGTVPVSLWSMVYSCNANGGGIPRTAYHINFGQGSLANSPYSPKADYLSFGTDQMYRGTEVGGFNWSDAQNISGTINIAKFIEAAKGPGGGGCYSDDGDEVCTNIVSVNRCFSYHGSYLGHNVGDCGGQDSNLTLRIEGGLDVEEGGNFTANSTIDIPSQNDVQAYKKTSNPGGNIMVGLSTDSDHLDVNFWHNIYYDSSLYSLQQKWTSNDVDHTYNHICTRLRATGQSERMKPTATASTTEHSSDDWFCTDGNGYKNGQEYQRHRYTVWLAPGETKRVCQRLDMQNTNYTITEEVKTRGIPPDDVNYYEWNYKNEGGSNRTIACVAVTRPEHPGPSDPPGPNGQNPPGGNQILIGTNGSDVTYVGESTQAQWTIKAPYYPARRLIAMQNIVYRTPASNTNWNSVVASKYNSNQAPCDTRPIPTQCYSIKANNNIDNGREFGKFTFNTTKTLEVPDYNLGDKYCNTSGARYQSYIGEAASTSYRRLQWRPIGNPYWDIVSSSCRTLAKKPNLAVWNGSFFTGAKITTSTAYRFNNPGWGNVVSAGAGAAPRKLYGSWVEYLAVIGGINNTTNKNGFASGSALYQGSNSSGIDRTSNSKLTIANNTNTLGQSKIASNTDIASRLIEKLWGDGNPGNGITVKASIPSGEFSGRGLPIASGDTQVYRASGNLKITGNIELTGNTSDSNKVSQIILIVDGTKVEIDKNVSRIDAWIIAPSATLNTCSDFKPGRQNPSFDEGTAADSDCSKQLIFNGPVIVKNAQFKRTYGAEANPDVGTNFQNGNDGNSKSQPAEIFNYRLDSYLWAIAQSSRYGLTFNEGYTSELVPRQ